MNFANYNEISHFPKPFRKQNIFTMKNIQSKMYFMGNLITMVLFKLNKSFNS